MANVFKFKLLKLGVIFLSVVLAITISQFIASSKVKLPANCEPHQHPVTFGLSDNFQGYTLQLPKYYSSEISNSKIVRFSILDQEQKSLSRFKVIHDKEIHAFIVGENFSYFYHLHPVFKDGYWQSTIHQEITGSPNFIVDFTLLGNRNNTVLGKQLTLPGITQPKTLPTPSDLITDQSFNYRFFGGISSSSSTSLVVNITDLDGNVVKLEKYLGVLGHAIAFNISSNKYYHFHSMSEKSMMECPAHSLAIVDRWLTADANSGNIHLMGDVKEAGLYLVYLQFKSKNEIHTLPFTINVS